MEKRLKVLFSAQSVVEYDGRHYYSNPVLAAYHRYKLISSDITVLCFEKKVDVAKSNQIDDNIIDFKFVKKINSLKAFLFRRQSYNEGILIELVRNADICIVNLPNFHGYQVVKYAKLFNKPYMTVLTGSAWDAYWNYGLKGKIIAPFAFFLMRKAQVDAPYSIYVTKEFLQKKYPTRGKAIGCSDVDIQTGIQKVLEQRIKTINQIEKEGRVLRIGTTGALNVPYKGQKYVIKALSVLKKRGVYYEYHLLGQGDAESLIRYAKSKGVSDLVFFHGQIPHNKVMSFYDDIDIYCQPSKTEGLPRSVVEAMSRGCLCIGSNVGGIPELIDKAFLFEKGHVETIVGILGEISITKLKEQAYSNFEKAREYDITTLSQKRDSFLAEIKKSVL